jgi:hypothetical protein
MRERERERERERRTVRPLDVDLRADGEAVPREQRHGHPWSLQHTISHSTATAHVAIANKKIKNKNKK